MTSQPPPPIRPSAFGGTIPSRILYLIPLVFFVGGFGAFAFLLIDGLKGLNRDLRQVVVPGEAVLTLSEPGTYTIFHEYRSMVNGELFAGNVNLAGLRIQVEDKATGEQLKLYPPSSTMKYSLGRRAGYSIFNFQVERPGDYIFSARYAQGKESGPVVLAVGKDFIKRLIFIIFSSLAALLVGSGLGAVSLLAVRRRRKTAQGLPPAFPQSQ